MDSERPIGVFDSGVGGLSVLNELHDTLPHERFVYFADTAHAPYGERSEAYVTERTRAAARYLVEAHDIKALVVACNTATAAAIHLVRAEHPGLAVIGVEPALKPAVAASRTGTIGVLATRGTLQSQKFRALHASLAAQADFVLQPCDGLARAIETGSDATLDELCSRYMQSLGTFGPAPGNIDTVVLGCTHYPFVLDRLLPYAAAGTVFIETGLPVALQTRRLLAAGDRLAPEGPGSVELWSSAAPELLDAAARRWLRCPAGRADVVDVPAGIAA